jgi:hypothetical protein
VRGVEVLLYLVIVVAYLGAATYLVGELETRGYQMPRRLETILQVVALPGRLVRWVLRVVYLMKAGLGR